MAEESTPQIDLSPGNILVQVQIASNEEVVAPQVDPSSLESILKRTRRRSSQTSK